MTISPERDFIMTKLIVTHSWGPNNKNRSGNAYIFPQHYSHSLESYAKLAKQAKADWKELNLSDSDIECLTITKSSWCQGHPIIRFSVPADSVCDGWKNFTESLPDIYIG